MKDFNFDAGIIAIHGKGKKDRALPIPQTIVPELTAQLEAVKKLHDNDLATGKRNRLYVFTVREVEKPQNQQWF